MENTLTVNTLNFEGLTLSDLVIHDPAWILSNPDTGEEIIRISKDGFFWKGEKVDDTQNVYGRFINFLDMVATK